MKQWKITFSHILRVKANGQPEFIITALLIKSHTRFGACVKFFKTHTSRKNKILSILEVK